MRFNLSRPHSTVDHRRTCAVIGCKGKTYTYSPVFCRKHDGPVMWEILEQTVKKHEEAVAKLNKG